MRPDPVYRARLQLPPVDHRSGSTRHRPHSRSPLRRLAVTASAVLVTAGLAGQPATAAPLTAARAAIPGPVKAGNSHLVDSSAALAGLPAGATRMVFIQLAGPGAATVYDERRAVGGTAAQARQVARDRRAAIDRAARAVLSALTTADPATQQLFRVTNAVPGIAVAASGAALTRVATRAEVARISPLVPKTTAGRTVSARAPAAVAGAQLAGDSGRGVRIGIVDTGIDYTHADFGGAGTSTAFAAAHRERVLVPTPKVVGGYDFVGDRYDASAAPAAGAADPRIPHPDGNPLDCNGHGTQVAGAAAGLGVDAAGRSAGAASISAADRLQMIVQPGAAPGALLYALKVFGCSGSTDAVIPALDFALDPNGDGDFADRLDIVDLSLTSGFPVADDPDVVVLDELARLGVLPVVAAGSGGDSTDAMGSPGTATRALTVAGSVGAFRRLDGLVTTLPSGVRSTATGQVSVSYAWATRPPVTGSVVGLADNADGCAPLSAADAAAVAGRVAWLTWDDNDLTRSCGSASRAANVANAGAVGVLLTSAAPLFQAGITGRENIPVFQLTPASTAALQGSVGHGLSVTFNGALVGAVNVQDPSVRDLLAVNSARGTHGQPYVLKPDVAAPASPRLVARSGSGNAAQLAGGTSLAAAQVAGVAAGVVQAHPDWTAQQVKAAVMETAAHAVTTGVQGSGQTYGPARVGAGRVDAAAASSVSVLAYSATTSGAVSVSFGVVEADVTQDEVTATQSLVVQNTGVAPVQLAMSYRGVVSQPGVSVTVSPATLALDPGASALATVTMVVEPTALRRTIDPTMSVQQTNSLTGLDEPRQFLPDTSGQLIIDQPGTASLRIPVYGAAKPVSGTIAAAGSVNGLPAVVLTGQGFDQKSAPDPESTRYASLTSVLALGYSSNVRPCALRAPTGCKDPAGAQAGRILAAGAGRSDADEDSALGRLWFGLSTYGNLTGVGSGYLPTVSIDTTADRMADYTVQVRSVGGDTDLLYAYLFAGSGSTARLLSIDPVNFNSGAVDTNVFDNSVFLIPVDPQLLGMRPGMATFPVHYSVTDRSPAEDVTTESGAFAAPGTGWIPFDMADAPVTTASPLWADQGDTGIPYRLGSTGPTAALVLHLQAGTGGRQEIVSLP